ncbi:MAG TPA: CocE/NonD family hydrolase, partial [Acidobacteriaceae bacterium]|nr:CocE/NonD family hydrolase [Acidobacteriaceae bacterium]
MTGSSASLHELRPAVPAHAWRPLLGYFSSRRRLAGALFLLLAAYPIYLFGLRTRMLFKAATILYAIDGQPPTRTLSAYTRLFGNSFQTRDLQIPGRNGLIPTRIYSPQNRPNAPVMVFIHGMTPAGYRDPIMVRLATAMAQTGLQVVTPDIRSEQQILMRFEGISDIDDVVRWAAETNKQKVSLMGVSFSGGLAVAAAAQPNSSRYLRAVLSISGYNDLDRLGRYYIQYGEEGPDHHLDPVKPPLESPLYIALQHLDEIVPAADVGIIGQAALDRLRKQPEQEQRDVAAFTPAQRKLYLDLQLLDTPQIRQKYLALLDRHRADWSAISPHSCIRGLSAPLYLLHGEVDPTIPLSEAEWNVHDAPANLPVHLYISPTMHHVVVSAHPPRLQKL